MIEMQKITVEREGGCVCIVWDGARIRLTPTAAAQMARLLRATAVEIAKEVVGE